MPNSTTSVGTPLFGVRLHRFVIRLFATNSSTSTDICCAGCLNSHGESLAALAIVASLMACERSENHSDKHGSREYQIPGKAD
jgi:hypothetical protein